MTMIRRITFRHSLAWIALTVVAAGCGGAVQEPEVRLEGIRIGGLGLEGGLAYVRFHVANPNRFAVRALGIDYDLELQRPGVDEWSGLANGTHRDTVRIGARDSVVVEVPVEFTYRELGPALRSVLDRGTLNYRVSGSVQVAEPVRRDIPFRHRGTVTLAGGS